MKTAILGGGAAGSLAAILLAKEGVQVEIFEQSDRLLRKVRASGNGRCNLTNRKISPAFYTGEESQALGEILDRFSYQRIEALFSDLGLALRTLESGRVYPYSLKAATLVDLFLRYLELEKVAIHTLAEVQAIEGKEGSFFLQVGRRGEEKRERFGPYDSLLLATGGAYGIGKKELSFGYSLVKKLGHQLTPLHPGILGLRFFAPERWKKLVGIRTRCLVRYGETAVEEDLLFTDYGLSGTAIFSLSNQILDDLAVGRAGEVQVDLLPDWSEEEIRALLQKKETLSAQLTPSDRLAAFLGRELAETLVEDLAEEGLGPDGPFFLPSLVHQAKAWTFQPLGARKKDHGQVTCGGIRLSQVQLPSLESRFLPGLYLAGEVLNVQGRSGGYNLHWAWTSAVLVAEAIIQKSRSGK